MGNALRSFAREPLLHFLLLGAAIFAAYSLVARGTGNEPGRIVVTQGQLSSMKESFTRTRQRPPTTEEWEGLIRDRVREEVYYREALALGLDKDDLIIRRRLQQKMEFVSDGIAAQATPTDAELNAYLRAHPDKFRAEQQFTFRQLYLNPEKHGKNLGRDTGLLLARLNQSADTTAISALGDSIMLEHQFAHASARDVGNLFGEKFAAGLGNLSRGRWQGPVESSYGVPVVFLAERMDTRLPALDDVRDAVRREWSSAQQADAATRFYQALLRKYAVSIEAPSPANTPEPVAAR